MSHMNVAIHSLSHDTVNKNSKDNDNNLHIYSTTNNNIIIIVFNIAKSQRSTNICHAGQPHTV